MLRISVIANALGTALVLAALSAAIVSVVVLTPDASNAAEVNPAPKAPYSDNRNLRAPARQAVEMKRLKFMIGKWKGKGWVTRGERRYEFIDSKSVQTKMKGRVFIIEGTQNILLNNREKSQPIEMLAVLSYDEKQRVYQFRTHLATGYAGDHTATMVGNVLEWSYSDPLRGQARYRIQEDNLGNWVETGEASKDGKSWEQFYENILTRTQ